MTTNAWDRINGSPNRVWRYMTSISDPTCHWWEYNHRDAFIVVYRRKHCYQAYVYNNAHAADDFYGPRLADVQARALSWARHSIVHP